MTVRIRDDHFRRGEGTLLAGGPSREEIKDHIWGPYMFTPGTGPDDARADRTGRVTVYEAVLPVGEELPFQLEQTAFPVAEAAALILLAIPASVQVGLLCSALLLLMFAMGTTFIVRKNADVPCMCFGSSATPMTVWHAIRDWLLCAAAAIGAGLAVPPPDGTPRVLTGVGAGLVIAMLVLFAEDLTVLWASTEPGRPGAPNGRRP